jgi:hypothetical protein
MSRQFLDDLKSRDKWHEVGLPARSLGGLDVVWHHAEAAGSSHGRSQLRSADSAQRSQLDGKLAANQVSEAGSHLCQMILIETGPI